MPCGISRPIFAGAAGDRCARKLFKADDHPTARPVRAGGRWEVFVLALCFKSLQYTGRAQAAASDSCRLHQPHRSPRMRMQRECGPPPAVPAPPLALLLSPPPAPPRSPWPDRGAGPQPAAAKTASTGRPRRMRPPAAPLVSVALWCRRASTWTCCPLVFARVQWSILGHTKRDFNLVDELGAGQRSSATSCLMANGWVACKVHSVVTTERGGYFYTTSK